MNIPGLRLVDYEALPLTAVAQKRRTVMYKPNTGSQGFSYSGVNKILFDIGGFNFLDPKQFWIEFEVALSITAGTPGATTNGGLLFNNSIESILNRVVIRSGSQELERIDNYNRLESALNQVLMNADAVNGQGSAMLGITNTPNDRFTPLASAGVLGTGGMHNRYFQIPLSGSGIFGTNNKYIPSFIASRRNLQIELWLEDPLNCIGLIQPTGSGAASITGANYTLTNVQIVCDDITIDEAQDEWANALAQGNVIAYPISRYWNYTNTLSSATSNFVWTINYPASDITGIFFLFEMQNNTSAAPASNINPKTDTMVFPAGLQQAQLRAGTHLYPTTPMQFNPNYKQTSVFGTDVSANTSLQMASGPHAYMEMCKFFGIPYTSGSNILYNKYFQNTLPNVAAKEGANIYIPDSQDLTDGSSMFILAFNLDSDLTNDVAGSGINSVSPSLIQFTLQLWFNAAIPAYSAGATLGGPFVVHAFIRQRCNLLISANNVVIDQSLISEDQLTALS